MMTSMSGRAGKAFLMGMAAVSAILACAPMAGADDPGACDQQAAPNGDQQQCNQQQRPGMPNLPDMPDNNSNNANGQPKTGDLADKNCWVYPDTGPEWFPPGAMPRPSGPGQQVWPCYYVYHLQPH